VVYSHRSAISTSHVLQCSECRWSLLRPSGLRHSCENASFLPYFEMLMISQKMDGVGGYAGWRWIFILEGILTVMVACIAFFTIYDFPESAKFLTQEERAWVVYRLKYQGSTKSGQLVAEEDQFDWKYVKDAFTDWQIYLSLFSEYN